MNAEIVALRVKLYNVERDLEDSKADYVKLAHLVCDLWHSSAAAYIPPWLQKRVRDVSHAQLAEAQRFPHGAAADAQQVPEGMALYKGEFVTARMVVERLVEAERLLRICTDGREAYIKSVNTVLEITKFLGTSEAVDAARVAPTVEPKP